jgi:hypothetical protein
MQKRTLETLETAEPQGPAPNEEGPSGVTAQGGKARDRLTLHARPDVAASCDVDDSDESPRALPQDPAISARIAKLPLERQKEWANEVDSLLNFGCERDDAERKAFDKVKEACDAA